jgi:hypothetical protein
VAALGRDRFGQSRPEILIYAQSASFQLWAGALEIGAYDVLVVPFTDQDLQGAVLCAAKSFRERCPNEGDPESI